MNNDQVAENVGRPQVDNAQQENIVQDPGIQKGQLNMEQHEGGDQQQEEDQSLLPEDLEPLLEDVDDGDFDPAVQQVLEIQHEAGVGQGQLNTQQFEERFFIQ